MNEGLKGLMYRARKMTCTEWKGSSAKILLLFIFLYVVSYQANLKHHPYNHGPLPSKNFLTDNLRS